MPLNWVFIDIDLYIYQHLYYHSELTRYCHYLFQALTFRRFTYYGTQSILEGTKTNEALI